VEGTSDNEVAYEKIKSRNSTKRKATEKEKRDENKISLTDKSSDRTGEVQLDF